ncbi:MAG: response regulator transcription factor [Deltaproteobacteria bacterium]|nr:response regulator transcription factor [Deltaproteobacteria bacterium]
MIARVLCIESNLVERLRLQEAFNRAGARVLACDSLAQGRALLAEQAFDLVVADCDLVDGSGLDLAADANAHGKNGGFTLIVLCDEIHVAHRVIALRSGVADVIGGPCDLDHLLWRAQAAVSRRQGAHVDPPTTLARRILLVDDSTTYAYALVDELQKDGHDMALAENGPDALGFLALQQPDLMIIDVFLPDMNGVELCRRVRTIPALRTTPILMFTGREKSAIRERALEAEADDFVVKSRDLESIRMHVRKMLSQAPRAMPVTARGPNALLAAQRAASAPQAQGPLLDQVVVASGLSRLVGKAAIERACQRVGVDPARMVTSDLEKALPDIEKLLKVFLSPGEVGERMRAISRLAGVA